jgi:tetratricopeptide (TPR) repeat protein
MKAEQLKEKARRHEQREEWQKALDLYRAALEQQLEDEPPDITLLNRVGDIQTRLGQVEGAVEHYEMAIDLYLEAELPNNAIAICKKVIRNLPDRAQFFLRMGQIRAEQGFLTDARQNFLTYAERRTADGDIEAALNALVEFVALSPEDLEIRLGLAAQLESHDRTDEAVVQYREAYRRLVVTDRLEEAEEIRGKVEELEPDATLPDVESILAEEASDEGEEELVLETTQLGGAEYLDPVDAARLQDLEVSGEFGSVSLPEEPEEVVGLEAAAADEMPEPSGPEMAADAEAPAEVDWDEAPPDEAEAEDGTEALPTFDFDAEEEAEVLPSFRFEEEEEVSEPLPSFGFHEEEKEVEEEEPLPVLEFEGEEAVDETEEPLPILEFEAEEAEEAEEVEEEMAVGDAVEDAFEDAVLEAVDDLFEEPAVAAAPAEEPSPPLAAEDHAAVAESGDLDGAMEIVQRLIQSEPDEVAHYQRLVEYAFRKADNAVLVSAYMQLAGCLSRTGAPTKAKAVYQQVLALSPGHDGALAGIQEVDGVAAVPGPAEVTSSEEYVDLGSMILGEEAEKTTRWKVTAEAPSGDDQADFAKMLSQFKEKVSEHVAADDVSAHHDLGTAYMEMGLLDEAIGEFQAALRASPHHLPTHEVMGRAWMEAGKPEMAARSLRRALDSEFEIEDELIGIYYLMGRAMEELGNNSEALEFFEKVFSLDINFQDVTERLRALR